MSLDAAAPEVNAAVFASAGSGKTWLLVTRVLRLLLAGVRPGGIVALTFTRKAAGEMRARLLARLREWASLDPRALRESLSGIGVEADDALIEHARSLYEAILFSPQPLRMTTFHALCQDVLRRFPLEAAVPPGFELLEATGEIRAQAWDALFAEATRAPDGTLASALETLFDACRGLDNTRSALEGFLEHRGDWWAYTEGQADPIAHAIGTVAERLGIGTDLDPEAEYRSGTRTAELGRFAELLRLHPTTTNERAADALDTALASPEGAFQKMLGVFFTASGEPRKRKPGRAQAKHMGTEGEREFLELHQQLVAALGETRSRVARRRSLDANQAWFRAGHRYLEHYDRLKAQLRLLDFTDLEWRTYQLLNHADNALWVQYKLDEQIDHLLIDEFQDTNPTQWRLILPLLKELAAGESERSRSVFLVGDPKQSIYAFRRAKPELQQAAAHWLSARLGASRHELDKSWRSCPVIMQLVNEVFTGTSLADSIGDFPLHQTELCDLWGAVELLPLAGPAQVEPEEFTLGLRDPLANPRPQVADATHLDEGRRIAASIQSLLRERIPVRDPQGPRAVRYSDIVILLRSRTHAWAIERGLREAGVPYSGIERGTLLDALEVQDLVALLTLLTAPHNDLALAQVLRSPIFDASDQDLVTLARTPGIDWMDRLERAAGEDPSDAPLFRAWRMLSDWRALAGQVPIHDLLDRIFHQAEVVPRYSAAVLKEKAATVTANLLQFLELALEVDSGRYPSIVHFLGRLQGLRARGDEAPDSPPADSAEPRVRIMTIHAAKGLESPVVFLADAAAQPTQGRAYQPLVEWPANADRPSLMMLIGRRDDLDKSQHDMVDSASRVERRERANLLYVALTRARQYLYISATRPARGSDLGWYAVLQEAIGRLAQPTSDGGQRCECGDPPAIIGPSSTPVAPAAAPEARLRAALPRIECEREIAPSHRVHLAGLVSEESDARLRGTAVHRLLDKLTQEGAPGVHGIVQSIASELCLAPDDPELADWLAEARALIADPALSRLFDPQRFVQVWNEVPILYGLGNARVHGVIDRLVRYESSLLVVDYKTQRIRDAEQTQRLVERYTPQMRLYVEGVARLWPGLDVHAALVFTAPRALVPVALEDQPGDPNIPGGRPENPKRSTR